MSQDGTDDLFTRLFELLNQPGPVNWKLAGEVARHLAGAAEPVEPWAAEEFRELTRLAEYRVGQAAPFPVPSASDVLPVDAREWASGHLERFGYLGRALTGLAGADPGMTGVLGPLGPALVGMQVGSLVGSLSRTVLATWDSGLPAHPAGPTMFIVPTIEAFITGHDLDGRQVRLWVAIAETAHRAVFALPWVFDRLAHLVEAYAGSIRVDPEKLMGLASLQDPGEMGRMLEGEGGLAGLLGGPDTESRRRELDGFLAVTSGYTRILTRRASEDLLPDLGRMVELRDAARRDEAMEMGIGLGPVSPGTAARGGGFLQEVERRFGRDALETLWKGPERWPLPEEIDDPVAWAARVLLEDLPGLDD
ncbi:MAG: zinc-dependent metalloprotease [Acidimicrobiia bacterium]